MTGPKQSVRTLNGVGEVRAKALESQKICTLADLLFLFPRTYRKSDLSMLSADLAGVFTGFLLTVQNNPALSYHKGGKRAVKFIAEDENGERVTVIYFHQPYLIGQIHKGDVFCFFGELREKDGKLYLFSPERLVAPPPPGTLTPVYPSAGGISGKTIAKLVAQALPSAEALTDPLPESVRVKYSLMRFSDAVTVLHKPKDEETLSQAKRRLAFDKLFRFSVQGALFERRQTALSVPGLKAAELSEFEALLPFSLTAAQRRAIGEIYADMCGAGPIPPMNRLLEGDVGSGKTVVAAAASFLCFKNNKSVLLMAPTEILASQHHEKLAALFSPIGFPVYLLTGSTPKAQRAAILEKTGRDNSYLLIGTHALIEDSVSFSNVALTITDEQQRFGVRQRDLLHEKGGAANSLVMTATPIPRTLAMFLYAGKRISVLDELPPNRQKIATYYVGKDKESRLDAFLLKEVCSGHRAYVVCPLIEDEETTDGLRCAKEELERLKKALPGVSSALIHGKMKPAEKARVMDDFKSGAVSVLVSTTVIEVGVDVPEATVIIVQNAERFGLSQLHQLRGRVGRGKDASTCVLVSSSRASSARARLQKLTTCFDGFELAAFDLKTRGPGEFFGTRQSGFGADLIGEGVTIKLIEEAALAARDFIATAPRHEIAPFESGFSLN